MPSWAAINDEYAIFCTAKYRERHPSDNEQQSLYVRYQR